MAVDVNVGRYIQGTHLLTKLAVYQIKLKRVFIFSVVII